MVIHLSNVSSAGDSEPDVTDDELENAAGEDVEEDGNNDVEGAGKDGGFDLL
jgi:hypothetical protein